MSIYREAKRRLVSVGLPAAPVCEKCGGTDVLWRTGESRKFVCLSCKHHWPYPDDRDLARGLLAMVDALVSVAGMSCAGCPLKEECEESDAPLDCHAELLAWAERDAMEGGR